MQAKDMKNHLALDYLLAEEGEFVASSTDQTVASPWMTMLKQQQKFLQILVR
jgi:hypothetical protein